MMFPYLGPWLFWGGLVATLLLLAVAGVAFFWPSRPDLRDTGAGRSVTSHNQSGGVTAFKVKMGKSDGQQGRTEDRR